MTAVAQGVSSGTTVYTVPTGKTFYCQGAIFCAGGAKDLLLKVNGTTVLVAEFETAGPFITTLYGGPLFAATSGQVITIVEAGSGGNNTISLFGYLLP